MAEVIGLVAAGTGFATLSGQLMTAASKLSGFIDKWKDCPNFVRDLHRELAVMRLTIGHSGPSLSTLPHSELASIDELDKRTEELLNEIHTIIMEMQHFEQAGTVKTKWKSLKVTLRRDHIEHVRSQVLDYCQMISSLRQIIMLWNMSSKIAFSNAAIEHKLDYLMERHKKLSDSSAAHQSSVNNADVTPQVVIRPTIVPCHKPWKKWTTLPLPFLTLTFYRNDGAKERTTTSSLKSKCFANVDAYCIDFQIAGSIITKSWIAYFSNPTYYLRPYNVRDKQHEIFAACRTGDNNRVQRILDEGSAGLFDVDPEGWTLLHNAVMHCQLETCRLLIKCGIDAQRINHQSENPLHSLVATFYIRLYPARFNNGDYTAITEMTRELIERGQIDPTDYHPSWAPLYYWKGPTEAYRYICNQDQFLIDLAETCRGSSVYHHMAGSLVQAQQQVLGDVLFERRHLDQFINLRDNSGRTMLHCLIRAVIVRWRSVDFVGLCTRNVQVLLHQGADVHALAYGGLTPLNMILALRAPFKDAIRYLEKSNDLFTATTDSCYGAREMASEVLWSCLLDDPSKMYSLRLETIFVDWLKHRQEVVHWWLNVLAQCGQSLHAYAHREEELHSQHNLRFAPEEEGSVDMRNFEKVAIIERTFHYGARDCDLGLECSIGWEANSEYVPHVPGAWQ